ncbi:ABC transporter permease subunit [Frisingicoccus sp.]|uniref:ABC transporter permease subunit n=1 Tax=Frisingicoccus sp. TaxID=1918627 RepID=UPI0038665872
MRKLLYANFSRLWKSKAFLIAELGTGLLSLFMFGMLIYNTNNMGENWMQSNAHIYFFYILLYIGAIMAIFISSFLGTEYSDGTIRNKLVVGHARWRVYLANLLVVCVAGILFYCTYFLVSIVCIPFLGVGLYSCLMQPLLSFFFGIIIILCYSALFTMIAMLDSAKARCSIISLILSLALILGGMMIYGNVTTEETKEQMVLMEDGSYERQIVPNPRYLTGTKRVIFEWIDSCLPVSQAFHVVSYEETPDGKGAVCLLGLSCAMTAAGILLFKKKDIK